MSWFSRRKKFLVLPDSVARQVEEQTTGSLDTVADSRGKRRKVVPLKGTVGNGEIEGAFSRGSQGRKDRKRLGVYTQEDVDHGYYDKSSDRWLS